MVKIPEKFKMKKKGEITTQQLVMIIVLIVSFVVILFFITRLDLTSSSDKQICHNSVVLRDKSKNLAGKLDCKTNYLCISGGGECEGITPSQTIKVNPESKQEIMKAVADEMADCWWMFGEGELDYLGIWEKTVIEPSCALCSVVKFDEKIIEQSEPITYREFYEYLSELEKGEGENYFSYLYETNLEDFQEKSFKIDIDNSFLISEDKYAIVTGYVVSISKDNYLPPYYLKVNQISSELKCVDYIMKA